MKKSFKISVILFSTAAAIIAAALISNHTYRISAEYATIISPVSIDGVPAAQIDCPGIFFLFYDVGRYFTPDDPDETFARYKSAHGLWTDSVEWKLSQYYTLVRCYEATGTDIDFEVTEQDRNHAVLHYYGKGVVITTFDEENVDDYWYIDMKPFWTGEAPNVYKMERPMSIEDASEKWEAEHSDVLERTERGDLSDYGIPQK